MQSVRQVVFVGGDARQLEIIRRLTANGESASLVGLEQVVETFPRTEHSHLAPDVFESADAVILPVQGMDDDGIVVSKFHAAPIVLHDIHFSSIRPGTPIFTGIARPRLQALCDEYGLRLHKLMDLDEVAILNSIPTAEGTIALAMENTGFTIHDSACLVLGFGRCGVTLARSLHALGAKVMVGARQPAHFARIREMGLQPFALSDVREAVRTADIVFNTIPIQILNRGVLSEMPSTSLIIDIASKPGGTDFDFARERGIKAILAPSLPGIVAPKTAGRILADSILRILDEI